MADAGFAYKNSKGKEYFLHSKTMPNGVTLSFFSKEAAGSVPLPAAYIVMENPRTGLPYIKKK